MARVQILSILGSLTLLAIICEAIRKRYLREQYALVWLLTGTLLLLLSLWRDLLHQLSALIGIHYPPSALLLVGIGLIALILLNFSVVVSELSTKVARLTQAVALLEWELRSSRGSQARPDSRWAEITDGPTRPDDLSRSS